MNIRLISITRFTSLISLMKLISPIQVSLIRLISLIRLTSLIRLISLTQNDDGGGIEKFSVPPPSWAHYSPFPPPSCT